VPKNKNATKQSFSLQQMPKAHIHQIQQNWQHVLHVANLILWH